MVGGGAHVQRKAGAVGGVTLTGGEEKQPKVDSVRLSSRPDVGDTLLKVSAASVRLPAPCRRGAHAAPQDGGMKGEG